MNKPNWIKLLGMIAAIASGVAVIVGGDLITGVGVIASAFSSATLFGGAAPSAN